MDSFDTEIMNISFPDLRSALISFAITGMPVIKTDIISSAGGINSSPRSTARKAVEMEKP